MKKFLIGTSIVVFFLLIGAFLAPFLIDLNKYKPVILSQIKPYVSREVDFKSIKLTLFTGLGADLKGFRISESPKFKGNDFVKVDDVNLHVKVMPLFSKKIEIKGISISGLDLRILKNENGKFNFDDLTPAKGEEKPATETEQTESRDKVQEKQKSGALSALLAGFLVNKLSINKSKIVYEDKKISDDFNLITANNINLTISDISLISPVSIDLSAAVMNSTKDNIHIKAKVGPIGTEFNIEEIPFSAAISFEAAPINNFLSKKMLSPVKELKIDGPATIKLNSSGNIKEMLFDALVDMRGLDVHYKGTLNKPSGLPLMLSCNGNKKGQNINIKELELKFDRIGIKTSGDVELSDPPKFNLAVESNTIPLNGWESILPLVLPYRPEGGVSFKGKTDGTPSNIFLSLKVLSDKISAKIPGKEEKSCIIESLHLETQVKKRGNLLDAAGDINIKKGDINPIQFENFISKLKYQADKLDITELSLKSFDGSISTTGSFNTVNKSFSIKPIIKNLAVNKILNQIPQYKNTISGKFSGDFAIEGIVQSSKPKVNATGSFCLAEGLIENFNLVGSALNILSSLDGIGKEISSNQVKTAEEFDKTHFDLLEGKIAWREPVLTIESIQIHNPYTSKRTDADAFLSGTIKTDDRQLNIAGKLIFSKAQSDEFIIKKEALKALLNSEQRLVLPINVKGSFNKPVPFLDTQYIASAMAKYYVQQGMNQGMKKLTEKLGLGKSKGGEDQKQPLQNLFNNFFK